MKHKDTLRREAIERLERDNVVTFECRLKADGTFESAQECITRRKAEAARLREKFGSLVK
jgi:hypothetical protein